MPKTSRPKKTADCFQKLWAFDAAIVESLPENILLVGADEVGRGSLIGPVVAAAACFLPGFDHNEPLLSTLNDSKQLSIAERERLSAVILSHTHIRAAIGRAEKDEVDRVNVHQASLLAVHRAYQTLCATPEVKRQTSFLLLDGRSIIKGMPKENQKAIIKGDGKSAAIAAASVVAKVYRDAWVCETAKNYPGYGWESNMGYPTPQHQQALSKLGVTPLHRVNYKTVQEQLSLL